MGSVTVLSGKDEGEVNTLVNQPTLLVLSSLTL